MLVCCLATALYRDSEAKERAELRHWIYSRSVGPSHWYCVLIGWSSATQCSDSCETHVIIKVPRKQTLEALKHLKDASKGAPERRFGHFQRFVQSKTGCATRDVLSVTKYQEFQDFFSARFDYTWEEAGRKADGNYKIDAVFRIVASTCGNYFYLLTTLLASSLKLFVIQVRSFSMFSIFIIRLQ